MLLGPGELESSSVVANNAMNRGRGLASYSRELGVDVVAFLGARGPGARWLDLCCGEGRAGLEGAEALPGAEIVGVDLVDHFAGEPPRSVRWVVASLGSLDWGGLGEFDLVTCVHGLHYVGDKLAALAGAASVLAADGLFVASFDAGSLMGRDGRPLGRKATKALREAGFSYDARRRRVSCTGPRDVAWEWEYLGADAAVGANYTGQEAVAGWYDAERRTANAARRRVDQHSPAGNP